MTVMTVTCPHCGAAALIPILYGEPTAEAAEEAERGELAIGGCLIALDDQGEPTNPARRCTACGKDSGRITREDVEGEGP